MKNNRIVGSLQVSSAYISWGFLSIYWNLLASVNSVYVLLQRIIWSMIFMFIMMRSTGKFSEISSCFLSKKKIFILLISGILISANWGTYIIAINSGHVLDASLGYFIEPIIVSVFGMIIFHEKLHPLEKITFGFSVAAFIFMLVTTKTIPVLSLLIASTFAIYAAVKKNLKDVTPSASLFMETLLVTPFAIFFTIYADLHNCGSIGILHGAQFLLLPLCGIITSIPLLLFNQGVRKIPFYLSGIIGYLSPSIQFLMGLLYFHESMDKNRFIAFIIIWIGCCFSIAHHILEGLKEKK